MLSIDRLRVRVADKTVLADVSLTLAPGEVVCALGRNGSGKTSLLLAAMGHPRYAVESGTVRIDDADATGLPPDERSRLGLFLSLQSIPEIPGVPLGEYLRTVTNLHNRAKNPDAAELSPFLFRRYVAPKMRTLGLPESFLDRDLYVGMSGGEKRRVELLQMDLLAPRYALLDEIDAGLDIEALDRVASVLPEMRAKGTGILVVTHNFALFDRLSPDRVIVLDAGRVVASGDAGLAERVRREGFDSVIAAYAG